MGELPSDLANLNQDRVEFLRTELKTCFTFTEMARTHYQLRELAEADNDVAAAEKGYSTLLRFLSDPKHIEHLATEVLQELKAGLERLRKTLDGLESERTSG
jgi:hypothetical protein